jgi:hypothetical protein
MFGLKVEKWLVVTHFTTAEINYNALGGELHAAIIFSIND